MTLRRIFVIWTCAVAVVWLLIWLFTSTFAAEVSSTCKQSDLYCVGWGEFLAATAIPAVGLWLVGIFCVAVVVGLVRYWRQIKSDYDSAEP